MATAYATLSPTGDVVYQGSAGIDYPAPGTAEVFGTVLVAKLQALDLDALQVASSGSVAFAPGNEHALDLRLQGDAGGEVALRARAGKALVLENEAASASLALSDSGGAALIADGGAEMVLGVGGATLDAGEVGSNVFVASAAASHVFRFAGDAEPVLEIAAGGLAASNLVVGGTDLRVPVGALADRPAGYDGLVFYNTDSTRFEGFAAGAWSGLGGVVDVNQDTYISAELAPGSNDDTLRFFTNGQERLRISADGLVGLGTSNPEYTLDIVGDLRISGTVVASATSFGGGNLISVGGGPDGSGELVDGAETNDGAGLRVLGVPNASLLSSKYIERFAKGVQWYHGKRGMETLGQQDAYDTECYWRMQGGAFHLQHVNADTGAESEFILRINDSDELQVVRRVKPVDGRPERYDVVGSFGKKIGHAPVAGARGFVIADPDRTSMSVADSNVTAYIESLCAFADHRVYAALYPVTASPTVAQVMADAALHGYVGGVGDAGVEQLTVHVFGAMHDGAPVPNAIVKFAAVAELLDGSPLPASPTVSFVLNEASVYSSLQQDLVEAAKTQTAIELELTFSELQWDALSAADKAAFEEWMEQQLLLGAAERGITVTSVDLSIVSGSIKVSCSLSVATADVGRVLTNVFDGESGAAILKSPTATPIPFVDRPPFTVSAAAVASAVTSVERIQSFPSVASVAETGAGAGTATFSYTVAEASPSAAVVALLVLATSTPLAAPVIPSKIAGHPDVQVFDVAGAPSGSVDVAVGSGRCYVYFVARNNAATPVLSNPVRAVVESLVISTGALAADALGRVAVAAQAPAEYRLAASSGLSVVTTASAATAYLLVFAADDPALPTSAAAATAALQAAAAFGSAAMVAA